MDTEIIPGLVSVMMPAYNAEKYIQQAIDSLQASLYPHWELIVVNDGSSDATLEIASGNADTRIFVISQANGGESSARNTALAHMRGEYIAFLDADDAYLPDHLELTVAQLEAHAELDGVYTDGYHCDSDGKRLKPLSSRRRGPFEGRLFEQLVRASDVFGPPLCLLLRRSPVIDRDLTYDTRIVIGPDWDFNTRFAEQTRFGYLDQKTCLYRVHQSNISLVTTQQKRLASLALCREKAIKLHSFASCDVQTRCFVFYDLLVELLSQRGERQEEIIQWPEFLALPPNERARIFRLMATAISEDRQNQSRIHRWLEFSARLAPSDWRNQLLYRLHRLSPALYRSVFKLRNLKKGKQLKGSPLGDVFTGI
jgi:hypothetical protein